MPHSRYHRQMLLPEIGAEGQDRLAGAHALLIGCGALGCGIADLLVRAGVGTLTIVDRDVVEPTNLQRQTLFDEHDARQALPKAEAAAARLRRINSLVRIVPLVIHFSSSVAEGLLAGSTTQPQCPAVSVILDGTDNFAARYLMNDVAVKHGVPYIYGGAVATGGMTFTVVSRVSPCLRCLFPESPGVGTAMTCDTAGILGPVASVIAAMQAAEAIKVMTGCVDRCSGRLVELDLWNNTLRSIDLSRAKSPDCVCCAHGRFEFLEGTHESDATVICTRVGGGAVQIQPRACAAVGGERHRVDLEKLLGNLERHGEFHASTHVLRGRFASQPSFEGHPIELTVFHDGRAIIRGTADTDAARVIYARYVGE